jgi:preprotein translocase subunit YajC
MERVAAFHRGWGIMVVVVLLALIPTYFLIRPSRKQMAMAKAKAS